MSTVAPSHGGASLVHWLHALAVITPPVGLLHVGAGSPSVAEPDSLASLYPIARQVLAVEVDEGRASALRAAYSNHSNVTVQHGLVAETNGTKPVVHASIAGESGLCPPEALHAVWPRLKAVEVEEIQAVGLRDCWRTLGSAAGPVAPNWIFLDCLPALDLLGSAPDLLAGADVVVARAVNQGELPEGTSLPGNLALEALTELLRLHGMELVGLREEMHPALVLGVFARTAQQRVEPLTRVNAELAASREAALRLANERETEIARLVQEIEGLRSKLAHLASHVETLTRMNAELAASREAALGLANERETEIARLVQEIEGLRSKVADQAVRQDAQQRQLEILEAERGRLMHAAAQRQEELERLAAARDELAAQCREQQQQLAHLASIVQSHEESSELLLARDGQVHALTQALQEARQLHARDQEQFEAIRKSNEDLAEVLAKVRSEVTLLTAARDAAVQSSEKHQHKVAELTKAHEEALQLASSRQQEIERANRARADSESLVAALKADLQQRIQREDALLQELREARQAASLSIKIQMLREGDLKDLQSRYEAATAAQEKQQVLLRKLSDRLSAASAYFHQLSAEPAQPPLVTTTPAKKSNARLASASAPKPSKRGTKAGIDKRGAS